MSSSGGRRLRFNPFTLDLETGELFKEDRPVNLGPQPLKLLAFLANRHGTLVTRDEIREHLWGEDIHVDYEQGISSCIKQIRFALHDEPQEPKFIQTVPRRGYRFVAPVRVDRTPRLDFPTLTSNLSSRGNLRRTVFTVLAVGVAILSARLVLRIPRAVETSLPESFRFTHPTRVTSATGVEDFPTWSPDGRMLSYQSLESGNLDIWVKMLGTGDPLDRTADYEGEDRYPSWSPDGRAIAFWSDRDETEAIYVMPALVGGPRKVARNVEPLGPPVWMNRGEELAYLVRDRALEIVSLESGEIRRIALPGESVRRVEASWSNDGRLVAYLDASSWSSSVHPLLIYNVDKKEVYPVTDGRSEVWSPNWSPDGRRLFFVSDVGGSMDLYQQRVESSGRPDGDPQPITTGFEIRRAAFSPDGSKLAYSRGRRVSNLWRIPIPSEGETGWNEATQLTFDQAYLGDVDLSPDGRWLAVSSDRAGSLDLWVMAVKGGEMRRLTADPEQDWAPRWSPDGERIAFYSNREGNRDIWIASSTGGTPRRVTRHDAQDYYPAWSPCGRMLAFVSTRSGNRDIWVVPSEGGDPRQLTLDPDMDLFPRWTPDGTAIVFWKPSGLWRVSSSGGEPAMLVEGPTAMQALSKDGEELYFVGWKQRSNRLWTTPTHGGEPRQLARFDGSRGQLGFFGLATDGEFLYFAWEEGLGDLWIMDVQ